MLENFDWKNPDYHAVFMERAKRLRNIRENPQILDGLMVYYRDNPADFINDWGVTIDPRNASIEGRPVLMPFLLFPKQRDWVEWVLDLWTQGKPGEAEKSRDWGLSWLAVALSSTLCLFRHDLNIGFGSRKEEYVDKIGSPKSLFWKARQFIELLPPEFRFGWTARRCSAHMRISFPTTNSTISGEAGDHIGRGDRAAIYFVDEAAYLERPMLVENALSQTTNCRIDISSANGLANPFAEKRHSGKIAVFTAHWRDDPRKDQAWYDKQCEALDPVTVAQEIDINYAASVEGVLIPSAWAQAAVDAHVNLGLPVSGSLRGAFDVADEGRDKNAFLAARGVLIEQAEQWSGAGSDITASTERVFDLCDEWGVLDFRYDADGLGAGVRGDARVINARRKTQQRSLINVSAFRGSAGVVMPTSEDVPGRKNEDFFMNQKAQSWWRLRQRFYRTYQAVTQGKPFDPDMIISISGSLPLLTTLLLELSQPTYKKSETGKVVVNKVPDGTKSPNLADGAMMLFGAQKTGTMRISAKAVEDV